VAIRLFVGNMPYGATEADLRTHFSGVGPPSQIVIPVDRETGRPRGFAFVEFQERALAEAAIARFDQQPFLGRALSVSEARPREERPAGGYSRPPGAGGFSGGRPPGPGGFSPRPPGAGPGGFRPGGPPTGMPGRGPGGRDFGPPKKKGAAGSEKRWEAKDKGPKGPLKARFSGRMDGLYDDPNDVSEALTDFDDPAASQPEDLLDKGTQDTRDTEDNE
jgi:cold-inducible RNA-binding protein